jgi:hypothetical protein
MGMIKCADCGNDVSTNAESCLHCGSKKFDSRANRINKKATLIGWLAYFVGSIIIFLMFWLLSGAGSDEIIGFILIGFAFGIFAGGAGYGIAKVVLSKYT